MALAAMSVSRPLQTVILTTQAALPTLNPWQNMAFKQVSLEMVGVYTQANTSNLAVNAPILLIPNPLANGRQMVNLINGTVTIPVPTGATMCTIFPPPGNTNVITRVGNAADTGIQLNPLAPHVFTLGADTNILLKAGATITGVIVEFS